MNRIWAAVVIAVLIAVFSTVGISTAKNSAAEILDSLEQVHQLVEAGDTEKAVEQGEQVFADWKARSRILSTYIPHTRLDSISGSLAGLASLASDGDSSSFEAEYRRACLLIEAMVHAEQPSVDNIL